MYESNAIISLFMFMYTSYIDLTDYYKINNSKLLDHIEYNLDHQELRQY